MMQYWNNVILKFHREKVVWFIVHVAVLLMLKKWYMLRSRILDGNIGIVIDVIMNLISNYE